MELNKHVEEIGEWAEDTFRHSAQGIALHTVREAVELALSVDCNNEQIRRSVQQSLEKHEYNLPETGNELADVFILTATMANFTGFDLEEETLKKHAINKKRSWEDPDDQGIVEHK